jgi:hypothetical protein
MVGTTGLFLASGPRLVIGAELIKCPSEVTNSKALASYRGWGSYDKGPGKLSGAWIQRLGDHYEEVPDPEKTVQSGPLKSRKTINFYRLTSWFGSPWILMCEYGGRVRENTLLWHDLPRIFTTCEISEYQDENGKEFEAYCK